MGRETLTLGDIDIEKKVFYHTKTQFFLKM